MINFIKKIFATRENEYQDEIGTDLLPTETISVQDIDDIITPNLEPIIFNIIDNGEDYKFYTWLVKEGEWVEKGDALFGICISGLQLYGNYITICASSSGVIEYFKKNYEEDIVNGDIVGYIHSAGNFKTENLITEDTYCYYFNVNKFDFEIIPFYHVNGFLRLGDGTIKKLTISWEIQNNEFVNKGDLIFSITYEYGEYSSFKGEQKGVKYHYAEKDGYIDINKDSENLKELNKLLYKIHSDYNQLFKQKFKNEPSVQIDEFNDSVKINWKVIGGYEDHYEIPADITIGGVILNTDDGRSFIFSFEFYEGKDYIVYYYSIKDFKISIGNKISFLFEDNIKHTFNVIEKPIRCKIIGSKLYETKVQITSDELKNFSSKNLLKWKIEDPVNNTSFICEAKNHYWYTKDLLQAVTKNLASEYSNLVLENDINYSPLIERVESKSVTKDSTEECYVYLMIDTTNNFHKIGISNNPKYREKTLQSDKPTIELLHKKSFPNRRIAEVLEKTLHITYSNKRIRGEWFDLDDDEISEIIIMLN